jgi:hypothetical protein
MSKNSISDDFENSKSGSDNCGSVCTQRFFKRSEWVYKLYADIPKQTLRHCCGSGSGIRCLFDPWIRDPGRINKQDPDLGWTTQIIFPRA